NQSQCTPSLTFRWLKTYRPAPGLAPRLLATTARVFIFASSTYWPSSSQTVVHHVPALFSLALIWSASGARVLSNLGWPSVVRNLHPDNGAASLVASVSSPRIPASCSS